MLTKANVFQLFRKTVSGSKSIESLFNDIFPENAFKDLLITKKYAPYESLGLIPRLRCAWWASQLKGSLFHITGDIHFVSMGLPRNRTILTLHDLTTLHRLRGVRRIVFKTLWFDIPINRVFVVTAISNATKNDILKNCRVDEKKIRVIPNIVGTEFFPKDSTVFDANCPKILQVGTSDNKNILRLAEAIAPLSCHLNIIGQLDDQTRRKLKQLKIKYTIMQNLTRQEVVEAYQDADIVSLVSTNEGFGLPILEGQATGRCVLTSNISSMPEVAGRGACLVDPYCPESIRNGLVRIINNPNFRMSIIQAGLENVERFSRDRVRQMYYETYLDTLMHSKL